MSAPDILEYIRTALTTAEPLTPARVEQTIQQARQTWGGDSVYIRAPKQTIDPLTRTKVQHVTRRTLQRRGAVSL